jgi:predicted metalloprotease with PDZ domain
VVGDAPWPDAPAYAAGLERGDTILSIGGNPVRDLAAAKALIDGHRPGDRVAIRYRQRGIDRAATLRVVADPTFEVVRSERAGRAVTPAQLTFRKAWLGE